MAATVASVITSCSDEHFDINSDVLGEKTIWENISSNAELSEYADILQNVHYSKTETSQTPETYADLFNGDQTFTVWAPVNGSFNYKYYKSLLALGNQDSTYKVEKELIRNNMTRFANVVNGKDSTRLSLFNSKYAWLNYSNMTIKGRKMTRPNIGSSNGVVHITNGALDYQPNLYEFLSSKPGVLDSLNAFFRDFQTVKFNESASTQGPTINGVATWVDSVTYTTNTFVDQYLNADIEKEDSSYVMILPSNNAWKSVLEETKKYFRYKDSYKQDVHTQTEAGVDTLLQGEETVFTPYELDSIINFRSKCAIAKDLAFNANWQFEQIPITSIKDIQAIDARKDSIYSTSNTKFKKVGTLNSFNVDEIKTYAQYDLDAKVVEVESFADMFGNSEPYETSNGYAYIVDDYKLPSTVYAPIINSDAQMAYETKESSCEPVNMNMKYIFENRQYITNNGDTVLIDTVFTNHYKVLTNSNATSNPVAYFKAMNVQSCTYDIFLVIGYNSNAYLPNKFRAYISYDNEKGRQKDAVLKNMNEDAVDEDGKTLYNTNFFVNQRPRIMQNGNKAVISYTDTICIAKDFEFPYCYEGLSNAYPVIKIASNVTSKETSKYSREIWMNAVILKPKGIKKED